MICFNVTFRNKSTMMQEVASDEQEVTDHLANTNIAQQLQEAAKTNVTQGQRGYLIAVVYVHLPYISDIQFVYFYFIKYCHKLVNKIGLNWDTAGLCQLLCCDINKATPY